MIVLRIVIIGAGRVAELHRQAIAECEGLELVGLHDSDPERSALRAAQWRVRRYPSVESVLAADDVDAVFVLTHVESHVDLATAALAAGKQVFVEKPVDTDPARIRALAEAANSVGLVAMPGHNYAYVPEFTRIRRLLATGELGDIRAVFITYVIRHPEEVARDYAGVLDEVMIHHMYLAVSLLGRPEAVTAGAPATGWETHRADDQAWMVLDYGRATVHAFATFAVDDHAGSPWTFLIKVLGTRGSAVVDWRAAVFERPLGTLPIAIVPYEESYRNELTAFADAVAGRLDAVASTMSDAAVAAEIAIAARASRDNRRTVYLDP